MQMRYSFHTETWQARFGYFYMWTLRDYGRRIHWRIGWTRSLEIAEKRCNKAAEKFEDKLQ